MNKPRIISLCSGAGIAEEGSREHTQTVLAVDTSWRACCSFIGNHAGIHVVRGDILDPACRAWCQQQAGVIDGIVATPPCPPFSYGHKVKRADQRSHVFLAVLDWIAAFKPTFAVLEGVEGLRNSPFLLLAIHTLHRLGYQTSVWHLNAAEYGTPQHRFRVFLIATAAGLPLPVCPTPTHGRGRKRFRTVRDAVGDLSEVDAMARGCASLSPKRVAIMRAVPPGGNWQQLPPDLRAEVLAQVRSDKPHRRICRRYAWNETPLTILTGPHVCQYTAPLPPHVNRPFSVVEYLRLQGVRREFHLFGNLKDRYRMVGNGVPTQLMAAVAEVVAFSVSSAKEISSPYQNINLGVANSVQFDTLKNA